MAESPPPPLPHKTKKITKLNYHSGEKLTVKLRSEKTAEWGTKTLFHTGGSTTFMEIKQTSMIKVIWNVEQGHEQRPGCTTETLRPYMHTGG